MATSKPQELLEIECLEGERNWQMALKLGPQLNMMPQKLNKIEGL